MVGVSLFSPGFTVLGVGKFFFFFFFFWSLLCLPSEAGKWSCNAAAHSSESASVTRAGHGQVNKGFLKTSHLTGQDRGPALTERMRELVVRNVATEMGVRGALAEAFEAREIRVEILQSAVTGIPISPMNPSTTCFFWIRFSSAREISYLHDDLGEAEPGVVADLVRVSGGQHDHLAQVGQQSERPPRARAEGQQLAGAEDEGELGSDAA